MAKRNVENSTDGFINFLRSEIAEIGFDIPVLQLQYVNQAALLQIGATLGKNKSTEEPYAFQISDEDGTSLLVAKVSHREGSGDDAGNFGIGLSVEPDMECEDISGSKYLKKLRKRLSADFHIGIPEEELKKCVICLFESIHKYLEENKPDEDTFELEFDNLLTCKINEDGKKAFVAGSEIKKLIKSDAALEEASEE